MNDTTNIKNMASLEHLLVEARDRAGIDPAIAEAMREAIKICRTRYAVRAGINLQLQGALHAIRQDRPDDAARFIEVAIGIQARWA
ncbi:MAG TPA: hypothetical protein VHW71_18685 [Steroidobacteraceae bacterium]|jgi:hypothetical protein|nr:hypothetical protein [Steroidobacteraceae bacterium]